jgi:hypothetical protein
MTAPGALEGSPTRSRLARACLAGWLLALAVGSAQAADEQDQRFGALLGYWIAPSVTGIGPRALHLTQVILADPTSAVLAGFYGSPSPLLPEARELVGRLQGGELWLDVTAADGEKLELRQVGRDRLEGSAPRAGGSRAVLRFSRASLPEFHRFIAENPIPGARAGRGARIELVYIGADDCSLCKGWEAAYLGHGKLQAAPEWKHLHFTEVKLPTLKQAFRLEDLPPRLRPVFEDLTAKGLRIHGIPSFVLLVNDTLRAHALGTAAFDSLVHVALRAAVRERIAAQGAR